MNKEQRLILDHARSAPNNAYCGSRTDSDLLGLVEMGFMSGPIKASWIPETEAFFQVTRAGKSELDKPEGE